MYSFDFFIIYQQQNCTIFFIYRTFLKDFGVPGCGEISNVAFVCAYDMYHYDVQLA